MRNPTTEVENPINGRLTKIMFAVLVVVLPVILSPPQASAQVTFGPFTDTIMGTNPCTGESFTGTGKSFLLFYPRFDTSGGLHIIFRTMTHVEAQTTMTLVKYVANTESTQEFAAPASGSMEATIDVTEVMVRQGNTATSDVPLSTGDDFVSSLVTHMTINANGTVTADFGPRGPFKCTR